MNKHRQGYIDNCPLRNDFLEILKPAIQIDFSEQTAREEEKWSIYTKVDKYLSSSLFGEEDTIDIKIRYIYYPLPYIKEITISDWKGGWSHECSYIKLEYWDGSWILGKSVNKVLDTKRERKVEEHTKISKDRVIPEMIEFFNDLGFITISKTIQRQYNLNQLV